MLRIDENGAPAGRRLAFRRATKFDEGTLPSWVTTAPDSGNDAGATYVLQSGVGGLLMTTDNAGATRCASVYANVDVSFSDFFAVRLRVRALLSRTESDYFGTFAHSCSTQRRRTGRESANISTTTP